MPAVQVVNERGMVLNILFKHSSSAYIRENTAAGTL